MVNTKMNRTEKDFDVKHPGKRAQIRNHILKELKRIRLIGFPERNDISGMAASLTKNILTILEE